MAFAVGGDCVIVATSTLELGLEVGDHGRVFQIDAPVTVTSLLQRMGRRGRRAGSNANMLFLATRPEYLLRALALDLLGSRGYVEPVVPLAVDPAGGEHDLEGPGRRDKEKEIRNNARPGGVCTSTCNPLRPSGVGLEAGLLCCHGISCCLSRCLLA